MTKQSFVEKKRVSRLTVNENRIVVPEIFRDQIKKMYYEETSDHLSILQTKDKFFRNF